jgi:nonribosomal peptide synthetase DhbF
MTNPFEDTNDSFHVLINEEGQYSIWPQSVEVPNGWKMLLTGARHECVDYVNEIWRDLRPHDVQKKYIEHYAPNGSGTCVQKEALNFPEERIKLCEWSNTGHAVPLNTIVEIFAAQTARAPDAVAVLFGDVSLTYAELDRRANQLAHHLRSLGVGPEVVVGLCLERSLDMIVGLLGILKAGGAYLPLDPNYPKERLAFMIEDASALLLVTHSALLERIPKHNLPIVQLDANWPTIARRATIGPTTLLQPGNLAYLIYTSGSTGTPKAVAVTHHNVVRLFSATQHVFRFNAHDVWSLFHSIAFDFSVWEIWGALLHGGRLVVVSSAVSRSPFDFFSLITRERVTVLNQTPSAFYQLMPTIHENLGQNLALRYIVFGGEALELARLAEWYDCHSDTAPVLINMYGITETTVHVSYFVISQDAVANAGSLIGRPVSDLRLYVLDAKLEPAPIGVAGEIYVAGAGLARGYLRRPGLTAERFVAQPFGPDGTRMYRTGDLGRWRSDNCLEFLGRADQQLKIRGFRIEPAEIEAALMGHCGVAQAAVIALDDQPGRKRLAAYVVGVAHRRLDQSALRAHLVARLPDYMIPSAFVVLDRFPLTPNGKLDRAALAELETSGADSVRERRPPRSETENLLCRLFAEFTGAGPIGIDDNFFDLGGDSLSLARLLARLRRKTGLDVPLRSFLEAPNPASLARCLEQLPAGSADLLLMTREAADVPIVVVLPGDGGDDLQLARFRMSCEPVAAMLPIVYPDWSEMVEPNFDFRRLLDKILFQIETFVPNGPIHLLGLCLGGFLAYVAAASLSAKGRQISFLGLIESNSRIGATPDPNLASRLRRLGSASKRLHQPHQLAYSIVKRLNSRTGMRLLRFIVRSNHTWVPDEVLFYLNVHLLLRIVSAGARNWRAKTLPLLPPIRTPAFLFRAVKREPNAARDLGWGMVLPNIEVVDVEGSRSTILDRPNLRDEFLRALLKANPQWKRILD